MSGEKSDHPSASAAAHPPCVRRGSVLSQTMIEDETPSIYESHSFFPDTSSYTIISLKQGQGFIFNQDLFATPYQQSRALANERKIRAFSMSQARKNSSPKGKAKESQRRNTSYELRPQFRGRASGKYDSAIEDDSMDVDMDSDKEEPEPGSPEESDESDLDSVIVDEYDDEDEDEEEGYMAGYSKVKVADIVVDPNDTSYLPTEEDLHVQVDDPGIQG
ncbi:hypothetical protein FT663_01204 [Candidozyma haemuli var. vulneris]|uniref:Uncharacterized protein n=1 Tax=Candidozyma haemuli TaxID=45357 RepID=A0A2V1AWM5_9ASCO|nr:hypothetical protein CXQ85_005069 [[Candida] haemuloni]KAF3992277.1 hypothetical protein FT662_01294 [[Candida] haemuloni var. vulneris]KAF3994626.1 hypothetical protein FT663_01204 [[Candida] haemuloni var. vulneris]PVH22500.1 hypothetical protein CXQ85_005069 [[Candida] haemuloni]